MSGGLYNLVKGVNPATFLILPMLGKHPEDYPRFRDCFVSDDEERIVVLTRVGGGNRNEGFGEEELYASPYFVETYDAEWDSTYGYYEFNVPDEWKEDFKNIIKGGKPSAKYLEQMCNVYPKLADKFRETFAEKSNESDSNKGE